jgi:hypothetical protein
MDEWTNFPGFKDRVVSLEQDLVSTADVTVVSADRLQEKWEGGAKSLVLARNGVDLAHYREHFGENRLLGRLPHPIIGYYGALASWVDVPLIVKVARRHPEATIVLAGGHFDVDLSPVAELPNVRLLGQRPYDEMPRLLWNFDVCMIPFLVNDITEATNPVKFYEYLYGEKPVVAPDLSELRPFAGVSYLAKGIIFSTNRPGAGRVEGRSRRLSSRRRGANGERSPARSTRRLPRPIPSSRSSS